MEQRSAVSIVYYAGLPAVQKEQVPKPPSIGINVKSDGIAVVQLAEDRGSVSLGRATSRGREHLRDLHRL